MSKESVALLRDLQGNIIPGQVYSSTDDAYKVVEDRNVHTLEIASGASLSGAIDIKNTKYLGLIMPAAWTTAGLSFMVATTENGTYYDLYDDAGSEVVASASAGVALSFDMIAVSLAPWSFMKIRSGTTGTPVAQGAKRTLYLATKA